MAAPPARSSCTTRALHLRRATLRAVLAPLALLPFAGELPPEPTQGGVCATCIGVVDETLGSCSGYAACVSSYDDSPAHFANPQGYTGFASRDEALKTLESYLREQVDVVKVSRQPGQPGYIYAQFRHALGVDDVEFYLPEGDATVELRATARDAPLYASLDVAATVRMWQRFERQRKELGFEIVPVLRNRQSFFGGLIESPLDQFGPPPPAGLDTDQLLAENRESRSSGQPEPNY